MSKEKAEIEITASTARLPAALRAAAKMMQGFVAQTTGILSKDNKKRDPDVMAIAKGAAIGGIASSIAVRGMDLMIDQAKSVFDYQKALVRLGISGRLTAAQLAEVEAQTRRTSSATGKSAMEVLMGGKEYMDLAGAAAFSTRKMDLLARAAQASGANTQDLAGMMYQLTETMGITDAQIEDTMGGLINQAKDGAVEAKDMAAEFSGILPLFARFKDSMGPKGVIQAGAMFQVIRKGFNSASEAGTGIQRVFAGLRTYASRFEKAGVKIWDVDDKGFKHARSIGDILKDISKSNLMKDPELLKKAFGRTEGWRSVELYFENLKKVAELEQAGLAKGIIGDDLAKFVESAPGRIEVAIERIKNAFAEALTPERIDQIVAGIETITESVGPLIEAASTAADAFNAIYSAGRWAKKKVTGDNKYGFSDEEIAVVRGGAFNPGHLAPTAGEKAAAARLLEKKRTYDATLEDITGAERNYRPTDASIRKAIIAARSDMGPDKSTTGTGEAARAYLADRSEAISEARYKRISKGIDADNADAEERRIKAIMEPFAKELAKSFETMFTKQPQPMVKLDGNPLKSSVDNASDRRRKP